MKNNYNNKIDKTENNDDNNNNNNNNNNNLVIFKFNYRDL